MAKPDLSTYGGKLLTIGYAGQAADFNNVEAVTRINESATVIDLGRPVARGTDDRGCKPWGADGDKLIGISMRSGVIVADTSNNINYSQYDEVAVMKRGWIFAEAAENVVDGDPVLVVTASSKFGGVSAGAAGAGRVAVPGATWETTTAAGEIGLLRFNLP
jgi:hypothetical protein